MEESSHWVGRRRRFRMGTQQTNTTNTILHRRSTEDSSSTAGPSAFSVFNRRSVDNNNNHNLHPNNFSDVFGGPPRTVLERKFSGDDFTRPSSSSFYEVVFRPPPGFVSPPKKGGGRNLPSFRIPAKGDGFYSDVFGSAKSRDRSRPNSKGKSSKSNSSNSVLSSEEFMMMSPTHHDPASAPTLSSSVSSNSKLRPISVPSRWNSNTMKPAGDPYNYNWSSSSETYFKVAQQVSSPETTTVEPNSNWSTKGSGDDDEDDGDDVELEVNNHDNGPAGLDHMMQDHYDEDDDVTTSYVIEINSEYNNRDGNGNGEAVSIDEAIAWAKEKFQAYNDKQQHSTSKVQDDEDSEQDKKVDDTRIQSSSTEEEKEEVGRDMDTELLSEEVRLWCSGKQTNIRLLLSSLHHIIEPAGWNAIPLTSLVESSQVKKGYQRARLCLHPDKLQQRGATPQHKYVAHKAFVILQDAWAAFISQDVLFN